MGFNFRKSLKIAPGVKLNIGKNGITSVSAGVKGARVSVGKKGTRTTVGIPGTGLSYSSYESNKKNKNSFNNAQLSYLNANYTNSFNYRKVSILLGIGIFVMPYIFSWFTLRQGYSSKSRWISFIWMMIVLIIVNTK